MTEPKRNEIVSRWRAGSSIRQIARELGLARNTVSRVLAQIEAQRTGGPDGSPIRRRPQPSRSLSSRSSRNCWADIPI